MDEEKLTILIQEPECWYNFQHEDFDNGLLKESVGKREHEKFTQNVKNKLHNIIFTIQKLTDVMRLCDITTKIMLRLYLLQLKYANGYGQGSTLATDKHYVGMKPETARHPNDISRSRCCFFRFDLRKESDLW